MQPTNMSSLASTSSIEMATLPTTSKDQSASDIRRASEDYAGTMLEKPSNPIAMSIKNHIESGGSASRQMIGQAPDSMLSPTAAKWIIRGLYATSALAGFGAAAGLGGAIGKTAKITQLNDDDSPAFHQSLQVEALNSMLLSLGGGALLAASFLGAKYIEHRSLPVDANHAQNTHSHDAIQKGTQLITALKESIDQPISREAIGAVVANCFDEFCNDSAPASTNRSMTKGDVFKQEMLHLLPDIGRTDPDLSDDQKLQAVKNKIMDAAEFMASNDSPPIDYPDSIKTHEVLRYVGSFIEALSGDEESPASQGDLGLRAMIVENTMKQLYAAQGYCNTGHVSRVLQGLDEAIHFHLLDATNDANQPPPIVEAKEFYTMHKGELDGLVLKVVHTPEVKELLRDMQGSASSGTSDDIQARHDYKRAATDFVRARFTGALVDYMKNSHADLVVANPTLIDDLSDMIASDNGRFSIFVDNALAADDKPFSIGSFATMGY